MGSLEDGLLVSAVDEAVEPVLSVKGLDQALWRPRGAAGREFRRHEGELVAIIGPNGAGKTTLLSIIAGIQSQSAGTVTRPRGERLAGCPQPPAIYSKLSVAENLELFARLEKVADPHEAVERMLEQTGLGDRAHDRVERLSGGNRQRVNVALGLISDLRSCARRALYGA